MKYLWGFFFLSQSLFAIFQEVESPQELQQILLSQKEYIIAIGMWPCIPCEKVKNELIQNQKTLPEIYWIDLKKHPRIRHVFNFKAIPFVVVYKSGEPVANLTGEKSCASYISNIKY